MKKKNDISKHPFKTPDNYFNQLQETLQQSIEGEFVPENIQSISKEAIFNTPENYFNELPSEILSKVNQPKSAFELDLKWLWAPALAAATIVCFVSINSYFNATATTHEEILSEVNTNDIIAYLKTEELSDADIIELLNTNEIDPSASFLNEEIEIDEATFEDLLPISEEDLYPSLNDIE